MYVVGGFDAAKHFENCRVSWFPRYRTLAVLTVHRFPYAIDSYRTLNLFRGFRTAGIAVAGVRSSHRTLCTASTLNVSADSTASAT